MQPVTPMGVTRVAPAGRAGNSDVLNQVLAPTGPDLSPVHTVPDRGYLNNSYAADRGGG